jgi:hypothetical protein
VPAVAGVQLVKHEGEKGQGAVDGWAEMTQEAKRARTREQDAETGEEKLVH